MDRNYLNDVIRRIEQEKAIHDTKFARNAAHANCLPRFETVIANLRKELEKLSSDPESEVDA